MFRSRSGAPGLGLAVMLKGRENDLEIRARPSSPCA
jgi:hypothetical protein